MPDIFHNYLLAYAQNSYLFIFASFVRSVSMDKWKDTELEKMKVGGNRNGRVFFEAQEDWDESAGIKDRYNTKAAALYRDKVMI